MDRYEKAALAIANKARAAIGMPPVDHLYLGDAGEPESCTITNTIYDEDLDRIEYSVATDYGHDGVIEVFDKNGKILFSETPSEIVSKFLQKFDNDDYPHLIAGNPNE